MSKFYLTTPLYYVNASPHIGHCYTNIGADTLARFKRLKGDEVFFLTGTDEYGEKIYKIAHQNKESIKFFVDRASEKFKNLWKILNISYDFFIRTTDEFHQQVVKKVVSILFEKQDIYKAKYEGFYCIFCEAFWSKAQIKETEGSCPDCKRKVEEIKEENYFFKVSRYQDWLKRHLKNNPGFVKPKIRYNEVLGFLENNTLNDLCICRPKKRVSWGIDFPFDSDYVIYVWFDALLNYISGAGLFYCEEKFKKWWPADIQFIGKDILRQHAVIWPIMLRALDLEPPRVIFAHGWWKVGEEKMSKSKGNIVDPYNLIKEFSLDTIRYFLLREIPFGLDGSFSYSALINRANSDLANDLGNLLYRSLNMAEKYFLGKVNPLKKDIPEEFLPLIEELKESYVKNMDNIEFHTCLERIWRFINVMNKFVEEKKPWVMWKEKRIDELEWFIYSLLEGIRIVGVYLYPFIPNAVSSIFTQLGVKVNEQLSIKKSEWQREAFYVKKEKPLFPRFNVS